MSTRNDRFNASMRSLDELTASFEDPSKAEVFSDRGLGVERMMDKIDKTGGTGILPVQDVEGRFSDVNGRDARSTDARSTKVRRRFSATKLHAAEMRLYRAGRGHLVTVLRLIVENGSARHFSLEKISRRTYFRHRNALLRYFCGTPPCYRLRGA